MIYDELRTNIEELNPEALLIDDMDEAVIGTASRCGKESLVVYSRELLMDHLEAEGMKCDDAEDYLSFNIENAWLGEGTPLILSEATYEVDPLHIPYAELPRYVNHPNPTLRRVVQLRLEKGWK